MSHYAEYKRGYIDDDEFREACNREFAHDDDEYPERIEPACEYCIHYDGTKCEFGCKLNGDECDFEFDKEFSE